MVIFGLPTTGKTTLAKELNSAGVTVVDTDDIHSLYTVVGDEVPSELSDITKVKYDSEDWIKDTVRERIAHLNAEHQIIILTNFAIVEEKRDWEYSFAFFVDEELLFTRFSERSPDKYTDDELRKLVARWADGAGSAVDHSARRSIYLSESQYMSDYADEIITAYLVDGQE
jgi:adenylate kinase family enzyme